MARQNVPLQLFNRGRISKLALARTDLDRTRLSAETQINWMPRTLGSMMLRPGLQYIGAVNNSSTAVLIPFVYSATDTALIELTSTNMRVWKDDALITRVASTSVISNGTFDTNLTGWTDADESGSTSEWFTGGYMSLVGTPFTRAIRRQTVTSASGTHGLQVVVERGRVTLRIGSSAGGDDYFSEATLRPGTYSLAVTSTGNFSIEFSADTEYRSLVNSVSIESSGTMVLPSTWAGSDLGKLRWDQSADVIFVGAHGYKQKRIERYATNSWGIAQYEPEDGPFRGPNVTSKRLTPSAKKGNITLSASAPLFKSGHVGALFRLTSAGQDVDVTPTGTDQWSDPIRVTGVDEARVFSILITVPSSTNFSATVRVQRSIGSTESFANVTALSWTSTVATTHDDTLDNQIVYYRIGVGSTYTNGSPTCTLTYDSGAITGIVRVDSVISATESSASVLSALGTTDATDLWQEGSWSTHRGWPSAVVFHEGRLWWSGKSNIWGSVSDAYESFDPDVEGDSGAINRTIASGGADRTQWLASLGRLIIGTESREFQAKTGAIEEPLTPTNFNIRDVSNQGSASVPAVKVDQRLLFVQQGGSRVMEIGYDNNAIDYATADRTVLCPEIGEPSVSRVAVQRQPDTRIHCVRSDGTVAMLVSEPAENVVAWIDIKSTAAGGAIEEVAVLPGDIEDSIYYITRREINGSTVRYLEKWAQESQAHGGSSNRMADSFAVYSGTAASVISATHLVGSSVIAWGATADLGSYTVSSTGTVTLSQSATYACIGLPYDALFKSAKLAYAAQAGTALTQRKKIPSVGLIMADVHAQGIQYGPSTSNLDSLPLVESGATISTDTVNTTYDQPAIELPCEWNTDSRLILYAQAPRPATVLAAIIPVDTKEKV